MHLITKLINFFKIKKIIHIITNILPSGMCVCCNIGRSYRIGGVNMIGKGYFKVDFYFKGVAEATKFVTELVSNNNDTKLQAIHSEKKIPVVTLQIRGGYTVNSLIINLDNYKHYGYCVWLSKEDDFFAVQDCNCMCLEHQLSAGRFKKSTEDGVVNTPVESEGVVQEDEQLEEVESEEVSNDDSESITIDED